MRKLFFLLMCGMVLSGCMIKSSPHFGECLCDLGDVRLYSAGVVVVGDLHSTDALPVSLLSKKALENIIKECRDKGDL